MKIYIHTGMHKTGTTSVQNTLMAHEAHLRDVGYRAYVNPLQIAVMYDQYYDPEWLQQQIQSAEREGLQAIIISAEFISTFSSGQLAETTLVTCFRHWAGYLPSRWSQNCLRRDTQSFPDYLARLRSDECLTTIEPCFDNIVANMKQAKADHIKIISYDNAIIAEGILSTLLSAFGLPQPFIDKALQKQIWQNKRRDTMNIEIIRVFNGLHSRRNGLDPNELCDAIHHSKPVRHLYDFAPRIDTVLAADTPLKVELQSVITRGNLEVSLGQNDSDILKWSEALEKISAPFLINPDTGKLFKDVQEGIFTCSQVNIKDFEGALCKHIMKALDQITP